MFTNKELPSNFPRPRFDDAWCPPSSRTRGGPATCHCWPRLFQWRVNLFWAIVHPLFCPLFYPLFCHRRRHSFYLARTTLDKAQTSVPPTTITNNHHQQPPPTTSQPPPPTTQTPPLRSLTSGFGQFHRVISGTVVVGGVGSRLDGPSRRLVFERWQLRAWNDQMPRFLQGPQFFVQPVQHHKGVLVVLFVGGFDVGSHSIVGIVSVFCAVRGVPGNIREQQT